MFKKAERKKAKLRLALSGTSGSGKTWGALTIAKGIGGKIAVLDTERGSASLYSDLVDFDVVEMQPPYNPERFIEIIHEAEKAGYDTLILDSITHEWNGQGGMLEIVNNIAKAKYRNNSYAAWNEGTPMHQRFVDAILSSSCHIIVTIRSKAAYVETENNGKKQIQKQGSEPQQRDGLEYEFTTMLELNVDGHLAYASKDRTGIFKEPFVISEQTGKDLLDWLNSGKPVEKQDMQQVQSEQDHVYKPENIPPQTQNPQSKALRKELCNIMAGRHNNDKSAIFAELSDFYGREISSTNDLADKEIQDFLDALKMPEIENI